MKKHFNGIHTRLGDTVQIDRTYISTAEVAAASCELRRAGWTGDTSCRSVPCG